MAGDDLDIRELSEEEQREEQPKETKGFTAKVNGQTLHLLSFPCDKCSKQVDASLNICPHCNADTKQQREEILRDHEERSFIKNLRDLLINGVEPINWVIDGLLCKNGVTILGGEPGCYKTWIAQYFALCIASGSKVLDKFPTQEGKLLYIDQENGQHPITYRFKALSESDQVLKKTENIFLLFDQGFRLDSDSAVSDLFGYFNKVKPSVVIIDSLVGFMQGDENKAQDMRKCFETIKKLKHQFECSFIILHHTSKTPQNGFKGLRGSGDLAAFADNILMVEQGQAKGYVHIDIVKNRHLMAGSVKNFTIKIESDNDGFFKMSYCDSIKSLDAKGRAINAIKTWINEKNLTKFYTADCKKTLSTFGLSESSMKEAINQMCLEGELCKRSHGFYTIEFGRLSSYDY